MKKHLLFALGIACTFPASMSAEDLFFTDFATADELSDKFTTINANDDGNWWRWYGQEIFCHCNNEKPMDDWLITNALPLEGGKGYLLSFYAYATDDKNTERLEIKFGISASVEGMTQEIMAPTDITQLRKDRKLTYVYFTAPADGEYYIGFHGISVPNRYNLYLDDIRVSDGDAAKAPVMVTDFSAVPDKNCAKKAELTFSAPSKSIDGSTLDAISEIVIREKNRVVATVMNPEPGAVLTVIDDKITKAGSYTWSITASNDFGVSQEASVSAFVGPNRPMPPMSVVMSEIEPGKVKLTWEPVTIDIDGKKLQPGMVTYGITVDDTVIDEDIQETEYTEQLVLSGRNQEFISVGVYAVTEYDQGEETATGLMPLGTPYVLPFAESFPAAKMKSAWAIQNLAGSGICQWKACTEDAGIETQDGDNGLVAAYTPYEGDETRLISAKVDIGGAENPALQVYYYNIEGGYNTVGLQARRVGENRFDDIVEYNNDPSLEGWHRMFVPLKEYAGSVIQFAVKTRMGNQYYSVFDNIRIFDCKEIDLHAGALMAPSKAQAGDNIKLMLDVENNGISAVEGFTATLYRNGKAVAVSEPMSVELYGTTSISFTDIVTPLYGTEYSYYVEINNDGDCDTSDNRSSIAVVKIDLPSYPAPSALTADMDAYGVNLTWAAPEIPQISVAALCEDFESYGTESLTGFGDWTVVDVDGDPTYGLEEVDLPHAMLEQSFTIFDSTWATGVNDADYAVHSGKQCAISMSAGLGMPTDDWLISPKLSGEAQTITFYARALYASYKESFEFSYSLGGKDISEFKRAGRDLNVPEEWTSYSFDIPEGANYFAIRCISDDALMFMVDDISYTPEGQSSEPLVLAGYNVYRNGLKINVEPITEERYSDTETISGEVTYIVTALYDRGESTGSNEVCMTTSSVDDFDALNVRVGSRSRSIFIDGAEGHVFSIFTPSGLYVATATAEASSVVWPVPSSGVYIVNVSGRTFKVIVR